jgi:hypothetical protein
MYIYMDIYTRTHPHTEQQLLTVQYRDKFKTFGHLYSGHTMQVLGNSMCSCSAVSRGVTSTSLAGGINKLGDGCLVGLRPILEIGLSG